MVSFWHPAEEVAFKLMSLQTGSTQLYTEFRVVNRFTVHRERIASEHQKCVCDRGVEEGKRRERMFLSNPAKSQSGRDGQKITSALLSPLGSISVRNFHIADG